MNRVYRSKEEERSGDNEDKDQTWSFRRTGMATSARKWQMPLLERICLNAEVKAKNLVDREINSRNTIGIKILLSEHEQQIRCLRLSHTMPLQQSIN